MAADPILLTAGRWLGVASGALLLLTLTAFLSGWGTRFRLVGVTSFTVLLCFSCLAFAISYTPRVKVPGALRAPVVYDNGADLVVAAAPPHITQQEIESTVEELARNLRGSGRSSGAGQVRVRLRNLEKVKPGLQRPRVLAEARRDFSSDEVTIKRSKGEGWPWNKISVAP